VITLYGFFIIEYIKQIYINIIFRGAKTYFTETEIPREDDMSHQSVFEMKNHFKRSFEQSLLKSFEENSVKFSPKIHFKFDEDEVKSLQQRPNPESFATSHCLTQSQQQQQQQLLQQQQQQQQATFRVRSYSFADQTILSIQGDETIFKVKISVHFVLTEMVKLFQ
jgi:hydroxymethylpyrimidine pyrophosphatase-like HAD family hydrolase